MQDRCPFQDFLAIGRQIEPPGQGDPMRVWGRQAAGEPSLWWPVVARNKKSVTANLKHPDGREFVRRLIAEADILVENFRPGVLEKLGFGWEALRAINPGRAASALWS